MTGKVSVYKPEVIAKIIAMRAAGKTTVQMACAIGVTPGSLEARMAQLGISKTRKPQPQGEIAA
jgi:hypothetical protein